MLCVAQHQHQIPGGFQKCYRLQRNPSLWPSCRFSLSTLLAEKKSDDLTAGISSHNPHNHHAQSKVKQPLKNSFMFSKVGQISPINFHQLSPFVSSIGTTALGLKCETRGFGATVLTISVWTSPSLTTKPQHLQCVCLGIWTISPEYPGC